MEGTLKKEVMTMKPKPQNGVAISTLKGLSSSRDNDLLRLNSIYLFNLIVTVIFLIMFWVEFIWPKFHVGLTRSFAYYASLTVYVVYKEIKRWLGQHEENRLGGIWVLIWWTSVFLMEAISFATQERFTVPVAQYAVALAVSIHFLLSRLSKCLHHKKITRRKVGR